MNVHSNRLLYKLSLIAIPFFIIYSILIIFSSVTNPIRYLFYARIIAAGLSLIFSIILVIKNKEEKMFQLFSMSMACIFLGDIYVVLHNGIYGVTSQYFFLFLSFFAMISFMTLILVGLLKRTVPVNKYLPLLGIIPVIFITILIWNIGKFPLITILYLITVSVAAYYIFKLLMSKIGKHFIFFVCCIIFYALFVLFNLMFLTNQLNYIIGFIISVAYVILPLLFLLAFGMGIEKCQK